MTTTDSRPRRFAELAAAAASGQEDASLELAAMLYAELRSLAAQRLRHESAFPTSPTSLVHEVVLRLQHGQEVPTDPRRFLAVAATAMRRLLIDRARRAQVHDKALGELGRRAPTSGRGHAKALEAALSRLERHDPELAQVVELRFLLEMDVPTTATALGLSTATVKRRWRTARAWLARELQEGERA